MKENTKEKSLIQVNENSIFYKIKRFFLNLFHKETIVDNPSTITENLTIVSDNKRNAFIESLKNIEDEETKLLKLQKQYRSGEIKEEDLTEEQIHSLSALYDKQIEKLKKSNELRRKKLVEYKRKLQTNN